MNEWSAHRRRIVFLIVVSFLVVLVGVPLAYLFYDKPTCFDQKLNGDESGVDCGGSCELLCAPESLPLLVMGDPRVIEVAPGLYEVALLIENPNVLGEVGKARYTINIYSATSTRPVKSIEGVVHIPKNDTFAIFEGPMKIESVGSLRATFEWVESSIVWTKNTQTIPQLVVKDQEMVSPEEKPRLTARLSNPTLEAISNIELVAFIYNSEGNIIAASKTFVENLRPGETTDVVFSWAGPFSEETVTTKIITHILPDVSFIR